MPRLVDGLRRIWPGFSPIEVLIVVGIIAALTAAIVPQFVGRSSDGDDGQRESELSSVQNAIDSMMAALGLSSVAANDGGQATGHREWNIDKSPFGPGSINLGPDRGDYFPNSQSTWAYCWDSSGQVTKQTDAGGKCD